MCYLICVDSNHKELYLKDNYNHEILHYNLLIKANYKEITCNSLFKLNASKNRRIPVRKTKNDKLTGKNIFHPIFINWSYRYRGKVARTRTNKKQIIIILILKIIGIDNQTVKNHGANHPPKNKATKIVDINNILLYSAKKNIAKIIDEYSVL